MSVVYIQALRNLALRLETLKIHGHDQVAVTGDDWKNQMRAKLNKLNKKKAARERSASMPAGAKVGDNSLDDIRVEVEKCQKCALGKTRINTVFGVGDPNARLMFIGEGPGADEDRLGEPFVGRAGKLLNDMIQAMGLSRSDVYIANIVKCRPPGNRDPLPEEAAQCMPYLMRQLKMIRPEFLCALGAVPARNLLEKNEPIGKLRGSFHDFMGAKFLATYHPSYLLRNPAAKAESWKDLRLIMNEMGLKDPRGKNV
ncbi:MAG: uracil-DNA glycosylase [Nitrospinota bacterium]|nr:uracil-DNA glycosylase [Nitrospinota bacterium]